jgi:hypothetical protein
MDKVTVDWANEQHDIIVVTYLTNDWQWPDLSNAFKQQRALLDQAKTAPVHVIVDVTNSQLVPKGGSLLSVSRNVSQDVHPKQGHTIIVGARGVIAKILDVAERFMGVQRSKVHSVATLPAAYEIIRQLAEQPDK